MKWFAVYYVIGVAFVASALHGTNHLCGHGIGRGAISDYAAMTALPLVWPLLAIGDLYDSASGDPISDICKRTTP